MRDPSAQSVINRIEHLTKIPQTNSESLQLLRYEMGQVRREKFNYRLDEISLNEVTIIVVLTPRTT